MPCRRSTSGAGIAALLVMLSIAGVCEAQTESGHGMAGFWMVSFGPTPPLREPTQTESELLGFLPDDAVLLGDSGLVEFPLGDYGGLAIHEDLVEAARGYDPSAHRSVSTTCRAPGLIYSMQGPFPIEVFEGRDIVVIKLEYFDLVRIVFMNQAEHPADWPVSMTGHSIGRWDADTLVVDTVDLAVGTLFNNGIDHTEDVHLIERFRLADDDTLVMTQQFEDPGSFDGTAGRVLSFNRMPGHVLPYDCDPAYDLLIESRGGPGD